MRRKRGKRTLEKPAADFLTQTIGFNMIFDRTIDTYFYNTYPKKAASFCKKKNKQFLLKGTSLFTKIMICVVFEIQKVTTYLLYYITILKVDMENTKLRIKRPKIGLWIE